MKLKQISVFLENKPGSVSLPCKALADAGINIVTLTLADTKDFGILRLITKDWEKAYDVLKSAKFAVSLSDVVALEVDNTPGGLSGVLDILNRNGINAEYLYASVFGVHNRAVLLFRFDDPDEAVRKISAESGIHIVGPELFFSLK